VSGWIVSLLGFPIDLSVFWSLILFLVLESTWVCLEIINLALHHLLVSQVLCIRIINIIITLLYIIDDFVQFVLCNSWLKMDIGITYHTKWLTHWIPFHDCLSSNEASNCPVVFKLLHWSSSTWFFVHLNSSIDWISVYFDRLVLQFGFTFWNHLRLVLFLHETVEEWGLELIVFRVFKLLVAFLGLSLLILNVP
jgi:hypothetical protein